MISNSQNLTRYLPPAISQNHQQSPPPQQQQQQHHNMDTSEKSQSPKMYYTPQQRPQSPHPDLPLKSLPSPKNCNSSNRPVASSPVNHRLSPDNLSQSPGEHKNNNLYNGYNNNGTTVGGVNHQRFITKSPTEFTTSPPLKKSFCIDALLAKNQSERDANSDDSNSETNQKYIKDDDDERRYMTDRRDFTPSPDDDEEISR